MEQRSGSIINLIFLILLVDIAIFGTISSNTPNENEVVGKYVVPEGYDSNFWHTRITKRPPTYIIVVKDATERQYQIQVSKWEWDSYKRGSKITMSSSELYSWSERSRRKPY